MSEAKPYACKAETPMINTLDSQPRGDIAATDVMRESDIEAVSRILTWAFLGNRLLHTQVTVILFPLLHE